MLAVRGARLFDGDSRLIEQALVLVEEGRIVAVDTAPVQPPDGVEVIDLGDVTLLPGLIDVHVHLGFDASEDPVKQMFADDDQQLLLRMARHAQIALGGGVTTVRDLGCRNFLGLALRDWYRSGTEVGPEIVCAGPPVTPTGGHCWFMGGEADGELEVRRGVRSRIKRGVDCIKIMATGGNMTPGTNPMLPQFTVAELAAAVEEAHRLGRKVTAHAHGAPGIARAVEARVDGIEHCSFQTPTGIDPVPETIGRMAAQQTEVCPTIGRPPSDDAATPAAFRREARIRLLATMRSEGVRVVGGTDAGIRGVPHDSVRYCVETLVEAGYSVAEAMRTSTHVGAVACSLGERKGRLLPGFDADMLAVRGDLMADVARIHDIQAVFRAGQRVR